MYIVVAILLFSFLIFIHELGHFVAAKLSGVQVNEFALFMGPKIFSKTIGETTYRINCIPLGGYCAMEGEDGDSDNPRSFAAAKVWKRLIILCSGAAMNFLVGFLIVLVMTIMSADQGIRIPQIASLEPESDLAVAGLQVGDIVEEVDGKSLYVASDLGLLLERNTTGVFDFTVTRDGETLHFDNVTLQKRDFGDGYGLRYGLSYGGTKKATVGSVLAFSWNNCRYFTRMVWWSLGDLLTGRSGLSEMGGPVRIVEIVNDAGQQAATVSAGMSNTFYLFAFIAVNLAVMNMLPIPALDGGRVLGLILTWCAEKILGRKLNPKYEAYLHAGGMILLLGFMAFITLKDVIGLFH